jgi:thiol-disulfide isomerase/thioredoxin
MFNNVHHLKGMNFSPKGHLLSKDQIKENIINSKQKEQVKKEALKHQEQIPEFSIGTTIIMCYASWCFHCQIAKPIYDSICGSIKCNNNIQLCAIDCEHDKDLVRFLNSVIPKINGSDVITGYPTFIKFENRKFETRYEGNIKDLLGFILGKF